MTATEVATREAALLGVHTDLTNEAYHAAEGVSNSMLKTLLDKSPAHLRFGERKPSPAMARGTLVHTAVLEPHRLGAEYVVAPDLDKRTKAYKEWAETVTGKIIVNADEMHAATSVGQALRDCRELENVWAANPLIEASVFWQDELTKETCRCRPDVWLRGAILIDLKTINDASGDGCRKNIENFRYDMQAAFYSDGVFAATGERVPFLCIFVEPEPPFAFKLLELDGEYLDIGRKSYRRALDTYAECKSRNVWPAYPTAIQRVDPSPWFRKSFEATQLPME